MEWPSVFRALDLNYGYHLFKSYTLPLYVFFFYVLFATFVYSFTVSSISATVLYFNNTFASDIKLFNIYFIIIIFKPPVANRSNFIFGHV